nr:MAG TPA: hypothetical protein [Caudoviricetes sp.]
MSYDISFKVKVEGIDAYVPVGTCDALWRSESRERRTAGRNRKMEFEDAPLMKEK